MRTRLIHPFALLLIGALLPLAARAQEQPPDPEVEVLHWVATDGGDAMELEIFFALRDKRTGEAVLRDDVSLESAATVQVVGADAVPGALDDEPQTPIKVALVIDQSRSMSAVIGEEDGRPLRIIDAVRTAAREALGAAPPSASFVVMSFARDPAVQSTGFLRGADQAGVLSADIGKFEPIPGNTCIADAADAAIAYLSQNAEASERKAIILFTDGKDREGDSTSTPENNCSNLSLADVKTKALLTESSVIPIYVVGPCNEGCSNITPAELRQLARDTRGFAEIGPIGDMRGLFSRIMATLNSQQSVRARVYPRQGENTATFVVTRQGGQALSGTVQFDSPRDYRPPPQLTLEPLSYDPENDTYTAAVSLVNPLGVSTLAVGVYTSAEGDRVVLPDQVATVQGRTRIVLTFPGAGLDAGSEYFFLLRAEEEGRPVLNEAGSPILGFRRTTHTPELGFEIIGMTANYTANQLEVDLRWTGGGGGRALTFRGTLTEGATGRTNAIEPAAPQGDRLTVPLPPLLAASRERQEYTLNLTLQQDGEDYGSAAKAELIDPGPAPPGAPWGLIAAGLLAALAVALGGVIFARSRGAARQTAIPQPFNDATVLHKEPKPAPADATVLHVPDEPRRPRLRVQVAQTPGAGQAREQVVTSFPLLIGRDGAGMVIAGDEKISRSHVRVEAAGGGFTLTDLSANGTWVGERRIEKHAPFAFDEAVTVRLGPNTTLVLTPLA